MMFDEFCAMTLQYHVRQHYYLKLIDKIEKLLFAVLSARKRTFRSSILHAICNSFVDLPFLCYLLYFGNCKSALRTTTLVLVRLLLLPKD